MKINFKMWGHALWNLVKMETKEEWDQLDVMSKWLIATRSAVTMVTIYSCVIAGILAWRDGYFSWIPFLIITLGLFIAHGTNNLLNDYTDFSRGVDQDYYFRTAYGVHPLVQGFWSKKVQLRWFIISGVLAFLSGIYALYYTSFSPVIIGMFVFGAGILLLYTWPLKYWGVGELLIFLIWGPIMISGVYLVLSKTWVETTWMVALAGVVFGLSVASINIGKHIDKSEDDRKKNVGTMPVRVGEKAARYINIVCLILIYLVILYLVFIPRYFTPALLIVFLAAKRLQLAVKVHTQPRPEAPPEEFEGWPAWFSAFAFYHNRGFGGLLILGLIIDALLRVFLPGFWSIL
jgi:1,4-dihydroxy-2-naphthoate octaprenyltransferase